MPKRKNSDIPYLQTLNNEASDRYKVKINYCNGEDPYEIDNSKFSSDIKDFPKVGYGDIYFYMTETTSYATQNIMKAYKSMEAYNFFSAGWVHKVFVMHLKNNNRLLKSKVNRSQTLSDNPHEVWIITTEDGTVLTGHCKCMAGLSEVCAHVAAVLFWVEFAIRKFGDEGCSTSNPNAWLPPTLVKVPYLQVRDVNFDTPRARQKKLEQGCVTTIVTPPGQERDMEPTATELQDFVDELYSILPTSATLKEQPKYSSKLAEINKPNYPQSLSLLYDSSSAVLNFSAVLTKACEAFLSIKISSEEASAVEQATRKQSHSKMWYHQRTGRVSASVMKLVCHTDPHSPSISLVKQICYPIASKFKSEATSYGSLNESTALKLCQENLMKTHINFKVCCAGFYIACEYPYIGASPDSIVECDCCGKGIIEVKCPFSKKDSLIKEILNEKGSCLIEKNGKIMLDSNHSYFYQIQTQLLAVPGREYCIFVVYTEKDLHIEYIAPDSSFQSYIQKKAETVFKLVLLPELISKFYTRHAELDLKLKDSSNLQKGHCYCGNPVSCDIKCVGKFCKIGQFHRKCLMISELYCKKNWHCPDCNKLSFYHKKTSRKQPKNY